MEEKHLLIAEKFGSSSVGKGVEILLRDNVRVNEYNNRICSFLIAKLLKSRNFQIPTQRRRHP